MAWIRTKHKNEFKRDEDVTDHVAEVIAGASDVAMGSRKNSRIVLKREGRRVLVLEVSAKKDRFLGEHYVINSAYTMKPSQAQRIVGWDKFGSSSPDGHPVASPTGPKPPTSGSPGHLTEGFEEQSNRDSTPFRKVRKPNPSAARRRMDVLRDIHDTGSVHGVHKVMLERFKAKGYIQQEKGGAWTLTKMGQAVMEGRIGKAGRGAVDMGSARYKAQRSGPGGRSGSRTKGRDMAAYMLGDGVSALKKFEKEERKRFEADGDRLKAELDKEQAVYQTALTRILGPKGTTRAVKISRADGLPLHREDLTEFQAAGWEIHPGGTIAAQLGKALRGARLAQEFNPVDPLERALGPEGETRAVVLVAEGITEETLHQLRGSGYDLSPAPKRIRDESRALNPTGRKRPHAATASKRQAQPGAMTKAKPSPKAPAKARKTTAAKVAKKSATTGTDKIQPLKSKAAAKHRMATELGKLLKGTAAPARTKAKAPKPTLEKFTLTGRFNPSSSDDLAKVWKTWTGTDPDQALSFEVERPTVALKSGGRVTIPEKVVVLGRVSKLITKAGRLADFGAEGPLMVTDAKAERIWLLAGKPFHFDLEPSVVAYLARKAKFGDQHIIEYVHAFKGRVRAVMAGQIGAMTGGFRITPRGLED
ncbi:MAG: hypothetical protein Q8K67_11270 [Geothrix sp.]|nr:hypothetical protein [Geothrix sp.]